MTSESLPAIVAPPEDKSHVLRRVLHLGVLTFTLFMVVKTVALEPFGVPTGSMAPAMYGNHRRHECPRCGYSVIIGEPGPDASPVDYRKAFCTNCTQQLDLSEERTIQGDRLLVDKSVYLNRRPRRWEASVFRCPADDYKPYVKRVIGLPGELIRIEGGDVYADGVLLRKAWSQFCEVRLPVFDMNFAPPQGWHDRWLIEPLAGEPKLPTSTIKPELRTVDALLLHDDALHLDATAKPDGIGLTYRHWKLDKEREEFLDDGLGYNGTLPDRKLFARRESQPNGDAVHDLAVSFDLKVIAGTGTFACRLTDGVDSLKLELPMIGNTEFAGLTFAPEGGFSPTMVNGLFLNVGTTYHVEVALLDRCAHLRINGQAVTLPIELPADAPDAIRKRQTSRPLQFGVRGASVVVKNFRIDRDIHYLNPAKNHDGWRLGADEYFMLGDNTYGSHDSRFWQVDNRATPGVPEALFIGKPFLVHQPMKPATYTLNGRLRTIQSPDWDRIRWMR